MTARDKALIVGGDSQIARTIAARLTSQGYEVVRTTRRTPTPDAEALHLDLAQEPTLWPRLPRADVAILCAAVARLGECAADPAGSRRVNVGGMGLLCERLAEQGTYVLFLSSDKVFDGLEPDRGRDDPVSPRTEYGRQKADAERHLLSLAGRGAVLRLAKVLSPRLGLLRTWAEALAAGRAITPFRDMMLAPVTDGLVADLATRLARDRHPGIFQLSGDRDVPYVRLAERLGAALGVVPDLIRPGAADPAVLPPAFRPPHSTLDMSREADLYGLSRPATEETIDEVVSAVGAGSGGP